MEKVGSYSSLLNPRILRGLLSFSIKGYLAETGWIQSYKIKEAVDLQGNPIPWLTYSFLDFLEGRLNKNLTLFEYGSGNSTLFFHDKLKFIRSIEYDKVWLEKIKPKVGANVEFSFIDLEGTAYENAILEDARSYDIVLVDGRKRMKCLKNAISKLTEGGVIILDDSERDKYQEATTFMKSQGFKVLPFSGIAIGSIHRKCTTVFYKENNVLSI